MKSSRLPLALMRREHATGPDRFSYSVNTFGTNNKFDVLSIFRDWHRGDINSFGLNFSFLTLIPKEQNATTIKKYRPISLTNYSFKVFSKCVTNRLGNISDSLITSNQKVFIRGRFILGLVVAASS
jgi:hypothetical protein